ncbi:hypothetical protein SLEP1_g23209 [Rubroshorea leprosula]|uniref:Mechanosensitive ion channel protein n=1 Tax=Rubroshorea leprosula TaxID=152421 RepID=A0AAV5JKY8_9ROSI|nr:hypothetical protein SLEP1_g23209 [Rubroshorea leprosula]
MESGKVNRANHVVLPMLKIEEEVLRKERENAKVLSSMTQSSSHSFSVNILVGSSQRNLELAQPENLRNRGGPVPTLPISSTSKAVVSPKLDKPPKTPRKALPRSFLSKSKSRMIERDSSTRTGSKKVSTPRGTPKKVGDDDADDDADDESTNVETKKILGKWTFSMIVEWVVFVCFVGCLIVSLTVHKFDNDLIWGLELWKWCVLVLVIFCGRLLTRWAMNVVVFLIRRKYVRNEKVLYFVFGVRKSVRFFLWLCLVLVAWILLVKRGVKRPKETSDILNDITRGLASCLLGVFLWLLKTLFVKTVAAHYQCKRFFDRIKEAIFHQHVVEVLSGSPSRDNSGTSTSISQMFSELRRKKKGKREELIKWLRKMKQEKTSAWTMKEFVDVISTSKLSIVADEDEQKDKKITSEEEARKAANRIFKKVSRTYQTDIEHHMSEKFIRKEDLQPYFDKEEVEDVFLLLKGESEGGEIKKKALREWLLNVYNERKALACSLKDSKTAIEELNRLSSGVILIVTIIAWLLIMGVLTTKVLLFISSQLLLVVFMFGNTLKTVFEAIIFVFVVHPFDVNDRCVIDGVQMIVEEMNLLTTVFLKYDNEKIYYPNAVLATKPIGNFYRSPDMGDSIEFAVDISTTVDQIKALKERIEMYLKENSELWQPEHSVVVKDFDDVNKMKMVFYFTHKMNFQNYTKRNARRSDLILELKTVLEDLHIKYHMLPLQAQLIGLGFPPLPR